jgi:hypothetical protein
MPTPLIAKLEVQYTNLMLFCGTHESFFVYRVVRVTGLLISVNPLPLPFPALANRLSLAFSENISRLVTWSLLSQ